MIKVTFIRHGKTGRTPGVIDPDYKNKSIIPFDGEAWKNYMEAKGVTFNQKQMFISPVKRCLETAETIRLATKVTVGGITPLIKEFELLDLKKSWYEYDKEDFNGICGISNMQMQKQAENFMKVLMRNTYDYSDYKTLFKTPNEYMFISHGTFICYLQWYLRGEKETTLYDVLNSEEITLKPLGLVELYLDEDFNLVDTKKFEYEV